MKIKSRLNRYTPLKRYPKAAKPDPATARYYLEGIARSTWVCEECGEYIAHSQSWQQIAAQCHILPKKKYPTLKAHPENRVHLCPACHNHFDDSWRNVTRMKIYPVILSRLQVFAPDIQK